MSYDDEIDDEYDDPGEFEDLDRLSSGADVDGVIGGSCTGPAPLDFSDPESAYLFLSDDAQDEIEGTGTRRMKCRACGHVFRGETDDYCPECLSPDTKEIG